VAALARVLLRGPHRWVQKKNMSQNNALATAAHLHVLLRRKTGRVTDTEWMANNADYAQAMVRFARERAQEDGLPDLLPLADRLEALVVAPLQRKATPPTARPASVASAPVPLHAIDHGMSARYVGRLR
jgi:hypothetical protein